MESIRRCGDRSHLENASILDETTDNRKINCLLRTIDGIQAIIAKLLNTLLNSLYGYLTNTEYSPLQDFTQSRVSKLPTPHLYFYKLGMMINILYYRKY